MKKMNNKKLLLSFLTIVMLIAALALTMISCDDKTLESTGSKSFKLEVVFADGSSDIIDVDTSKTYVGEALIEKGIISGENGPYGLYIMTVCDEYHKYEEDGKYWAFYVNGEYAMSGVDSTEIVDGATYALKAE